MKMEETGFAYNVGDIVQCKTCHGDVMEGEVIAFDYNSRLIAIKSRSPQKSATFDVRFINLGAAVDVKLVREAVKEPASLPNLNMGKLSQRADANKNEKRRQIRNIGDGVTVEAQRIFDYLNKTISDMQWNGPNIVILDSVTISPPYRQEHCASHLQDEKGLAQVKRLIQKYYQDQAKESSPSSQQ